MRDFLDAVVLTIGSILAVIGGVACLLALVAHARLREYRKHGARR